MPRFLKQFFYGTFFVVIISAFVFGVYYLAFRETPTCSDGIRNQNEDGIDCGDPCGISCALKNIKSLTVSAPMIFQKGSLTSILFLVTNPNSAYGAEEISYKIYFYDKNNNLLKSLARESFIYAGEEDKVFTEVGVDTGAYATAKTEIKIIDAKWVPAAQFQPPVFETDKLKTEKKGDKFVISGVIKNVNNSSISQVIINAVLVDRVGAEIGITKTELNDLAPFEQRSFEVFAQTDQFAVGEPSTSNTQFFISVKRK